ncbi:MAG: hypothetical protein UV82_C0002G0031 [Candidatus Magasanikbacteria bacterium GW2011_GWD2_43_18]|nr:MAG: hypothetical protein UV18_C0003G0031 [Candidatus Magasanikbacteria bacterium GW2011_GWC2_42_27]KKT05061.1 MAG: hypothetical protein UV82_C0002G0031 [Candidatus Magasanikbacteria bacterium GW2011_GWD2_43_18]KKT24778.1 MAG: hypothetical protein UW10_C0020G0031 [Candidatus Magasanikbacteria bacterium GW2011_GWA2_43_9]
MIKVDTSHPVDDIGQDRDFTSDRPVDAPGQHHKAKQDE